MNQIEVIDLEQFYNISISDFYSYVSEIMTDFNYFFHLTLKEIPNKTRCEIWKHRGGEEEALVWVEVVQNGEYVASEVPVEILKLMNENNLRTLFFFTNGALIEEDKEIIDEEGYFIFTPDEIIETLIAISKKKIPKNKNIRKKVKVPSGFVLIRNYLRNREIPKEKNVIRINLIKQIVDKYISLYEPILKIVEQIEDYNDISDEIKEILKKEQFKLLPNLVVISTYTFLDKFQYLKVDLFNFVKLLILYIGAIIEYEPMEDVEKYKSEIEKFVEKFKNIENEIEEYKKEYLEENKKLSKNLLINSIVFIVLLFIIVIIYVVINGRY